jgi:hypothetical protein
MQYGRQRAEWDRTAAMIVHFRQVLGDAQITFHAVHPHYVTISRADQKKTFKAMSKAGQQQQMERKK